MFSPLKKSIPALGEKYTSNFYDVIYQGAVEKVTMKTQSHPASVFVL
jgi:hypothetical protein